MPSPPRSRARPPILAGVASLVLTALGCAGSAPTRCPPGQRYYPANAGRGSCVAPTPDGGRLCHRQADCSFACWADEVDPSIARCAAWPIYDGCHTQVEDGRRTSRCTMQ